MQPAVLVVTAVRVEAEELPALDWTVGGPSLCWWAVRKVSEQARKQHSVVTA